MLIDDITFFSIICLFSFTERRSPTTYPMNRSEEQQRVQRPPSPQQRQQAYHQPQPRQPAWFPNPPSAPSYQGGIGASSSSQSRSSSRSQTLPSFSSELYSEGQPEIKPLYRGSSMAEPPAIETQEAVPEQRKPHRSPIVNKDPGTSTEEGGSPSTGISTRRKPSTKVSVACEFCRGKHIGHHSTLVPENLIELSIGISIRTVCYGFGSRLFCCRAGC